jgi:hypothetical protein
MRESRKKPGRFTETYYSEEKANKANINKTGIAYGILSGMPISRKIRVIVLIALASFIVFLVGVTWAQQKKTERHACHYLIPNGYVGWVHVYFEVKEEPSLPLQGDALEFKFPANGVLQTSSKLEAGWSKGDKYFYYQPSGKLKELRDTGWGGGGMIWVQMNGVADQYFFVGTEQQLHDSPQTTDAQNEPKAGNQNK